MAVQLRKTRAIASLSILPLIDVVFLLIIFFLVATRFVRAEQELDLQLPSASEAVPLTAEIQEIVINIDKDGRFFMDGKFRLIEEIELALRKRVADNPFTQTVIIRADKQADCQYFITAVDLCKRVGIENYTAMIDEPGQ